MRPPPPALCKTMKGHKNLPSYVTTESDINYLQHPAGIASRTVWVESGPSTRELVTLAQSPGSPGAPFSPL